MAPPDGSSAIHVIVSSRPGSRRGRQLQSAGSAVISSESEATSTKVLNQRAKEVVGNHGFELHSAASSLLEQYKQQSAAHCEFSLHLCYFRLIFINLFI